MCAPDPARLSRALTAPGLNWDDLLYRADGHGITPLLCGLWRRLELMDRVPAPARSRVEQAYADNAVRNADAGRELHELMERMAEARVESLVLKGLPLIRQLYDDPAERVLYDLDLLAQSVQEAERGYRALLDAGYMPVPTKPGAAVEKHLPSVWRANGFVRREYLFDVTLLRPVEMHLTLWDRNWRGLTLGVLPALWERSRVVDIDGMRVRTLSPEDTCVHLCVHLATHLVEREARLGQASDVARLLLSRASTLDWQYIVQAGDDARVIRLVYLALRVVGALTGAPLPPASILETLAARTPPALRQWAEQQSGNDLLAMDYRRVDLARAYSLTFAAADSWRESASVVRFALLPSRDALRQEYGGDSLLEYARHAGRRGRAYFNARLKRA